MSEGRHCLLLNYICLSFDRLLCCLQGGELALRPLLRACFTPENACQAELLTPLPQRSFNVEKDLGSARKSRKVLRRTQ